MVTNCLNNDDANDGECVEELQTGVNEPKDY